MRHRKESLLLVGLLVMSTLLSACAKTTLDKAIQAADIQKQLVQTCTVQEIVMCDKGQIKPEVCAQVKILYGKWAVGQQAVADTLVAWKVVASPENENKLLAALTFVKPLADDYLAFIGKFVDVSAVATGLGK